MFGVSRPSLLLHVGMLTPLVSERDWELSLDC